MPAHTNAFSIIFPYIIENNAHLINLRYAAEVPWTDLVYGHWCRAVYKVDANTHNQANA